jgi:hypothetical protein
MNEKLDGPSVSVLRRTIAEAKQYWSVIGWAYVVGYGPFSLCVIHKEGLCPSSGDINGLMMIMMMK